MKTTSIIALIFISGVIYYVTGGGILFGLGGSTNLPETIEAPNATFMGDAQDNPFFDTGV